MKCVFHLRAPPVYKKSAPQPSPVIIPCHDLLRFLPVALPNPRVPLCCAPRGGALGCAPRGGALDCSGTKTKLGAILVLWHLDLGGNDSTATVRGSLKRAGPADPVLSFVLVLLLMMLTTTHVENDTC